MNFRPETASTLMVMLIVFAGSFLRLYLRQRGWPTFKLSGRVARTVLVDAAMAALLAWTFLLTFETPPRLATLVIPAGFILVTVIALLRRRAERRKLKAALEHSTTTAEAPHS